MSRSTVRWRFLICVFVLMTFIIASSSVYGKDDRINPKEYGAYVKTEKGLKRLLANVVFTGEEGIYYIEPNNPARFILKDVEYFVFFGKYDFEYLTLNPMVFFRATIGKPSFMFGKTVEADLKKIGTDLYTYKPKGLLGRGYYSLWINDSAWDFILD